MTKNLKFCTFTVDKIVRKADKPYQAIDLKGYFMSAQKSGSIGC